MNITCVRQQGESLTFLIIPSFTLIGVHFSLDSSSIFVFCTLFLELYKYVNHETTGGETSDSVDQQNEEYQIKLLKEEEDEAEDEDYLCKKTCFALTRHLK